jgi:hypothetical protein
VRYPAHVAGRALGISIGLALACASQTADAQPASPDYAPLVRQSSDSATPKPVAWHDSSVLWSQRLSTENVGVGHDYQTRNPFYDWNFYLRPRYYLWENERSSLSLRGQLWTSVEFTNSDTTTRKNELVFEDTLLSLVPQHSFVMNGDYLTDLTLSLPRVVLPTSKPSYDSGYIANVGVRAFLLQAFPLRENEPVLARGHVGLRVGYGYQFARAVVPELSTLNQLRMDLEGHSVSNDQLIGAALIEHLGVVHGVVGADLWRDRLSIEGEAGIDPASRFRLRNQPVLTATGPYTPLQVSNPTRYGVATLFDLYVELKSFGGALKSDLGWENITGQLAPGSYRRTMFWSPDAKLYLKFEFVPDLLLAPRATTIARGLARPSVASAR